MNYWTCDFRNSIDADSRTATVIQFYLGRFKKNGVSREPWFFLNVSMVTWSTVEVVI